MLDAAHGEAVGTVEVAHGVDVFLSEAEATDTGTAGSVRRRGPEPTSRADGIQGSRRIVAVARSRRVKQSLG